MKRTMLVLVLAAAVASQGCSFLMTRSPEPMAVTGVPCNTSAVPAGIDLAASGMYALVAAAMSNRDPDDFEHTDYGISSFVAGSSAVSALVLGVSAAYGYSKVGACKRLRGAEMARMQRPPASAPEPAPTEWRTPSVPGGDQEPPFEIEVHTDVIVRPRP